MTRTIKSVNVLRVRNPAFAAKGEYAHLEIEVWRAELQDQSEVLASYAGSSEDSVNYHVKRLRELARHGTREYISSFSSEGKVTFRWQGDDGRGWNGGHTMRRTFTIDRECVEYQATYHNWYGGKVDSMGRFFTENGTELLTKIHKLLGKAGRGHYVYDDDPRAFVTVLLAAGFKPVKYVDSISDFIIDKAFDIDIELPSGDTVAAVKGLDAFHELMTSRTAD